MTPDEIISDARELDPSFTAQRHPRRVAINYLSRLQRRLVEEWAKLEETAHVETYVVTFPLADFDAGVELLDPEESVDTALEIAAVHRPLDLFLRGYEQPVSMDLIRWGDRNRRVHDRAAYLEENRLKFTGLEADYADVERVEFTYTPTARDIEDPAEALLLPRSAEDALVTALGAFFARRSNTKELARPRAEYISEAHDAEALWLDGIRRRQGASVSRTREVW